MIGRVWERLARPWKDAAAVIAEPIGWDKPPVPETGANPPAPPVPRGHPAREPYPGASAPALPRRPPPSCPDGCGAPLSYTIRVWDCDQVRLYGPHGHLAGRTRCLDGELRRLFHDMAGDPDGV